MFFGFWLLSAAINNPIEEPWRLPSSHQTDSDVTPFPTDAVGDVEVLVEQDYYATLQEDDPTFEVSNAEGDQVQTHYSGPFGPYVGSYEVVAEVEVPAGSSYFVSYPEGFAGRVVFVVDGDMPTRSNWGAIVTGGVVAALGAAVALFGVFRRRRWQAELRRYRAEAETQGFGT
ncbi:MAG: hypothetical protein U5R31_03875 [Acidimicrobiia bacterium]|nr:hypothetical protein [Acidimicrobiia bacterium]